MSYFARITHFMVYIFYRLDAGLLLAALLTLFIIQNLWQPGLPTLADLPIHLYRTFEYGQAWSSGVITPRWAPNLAYGYGYPLFVFAPPLPYWLGLFFYTLGFPMETAFKLLIILTILLYAIGMYLLARALLHSVEAGLVAAVAYIFAPFALRESLLYGGNIPQFLAIGLFPWTLWAMVRAAQNRSWTWTILAACFFAGVLLSHLFQALIFTPVVGVFGLIWSINVRGNFSVEPLYKRRILFIPLIVIPLGLLLTSFFWLPAFAERGFTRAQADIYLAKSPFYTRYPHWTELVAWIQPLDARAANPYAPLTLGVVTLALTTLGLAMGVWDVAPFLAKLVGFGRQKVLTSKLSPIYPLRLPTLSTIFIIFFAFVAALAVFMTLPISRPVWEIVTILQVAEFPWRMLGLANLGLAFLAGSALLWSPPRFRGLLTIILVCLQIIAVGPYLYPVIPFTRYSQVTIAHQTDYERRSQSIGTTTLGEYLPQTVQHPPTTSPLVESLLAGQSLERLDRDSLPPQAKAKLLTQNAVTHIYQLDTPTDFTLRFFQFDYPGWQAQLDGHPIPLRPEPKTGLILIDLPAGQHTLTIHFGETPLRIIALALTGFTIISLTIAGLFRFNRKTVHKKANPPHPSNLPTFQPPTLQPSNLPPSTFHPFRFLLPGLLFIIITAFWFKPLLRPVFTVDSPPDQALAARYKTKIDFANGIQLIGYDLDKKIIRPGERLLATLYWQTNVAPLKTNLQPFVHLDRLDDFTTVADATNYTPGDVTTESVLPTFHWDNTRYVRDEHDLILSPGTLPLAYAVRIGLIDPDQQNRLIPLADGSGDTAQLTLVNVAPSPGPAPRLAEPLEVSFQTDHASIRLIGFELDSIRSPGRIDFKLAWQVEETPSTDYTIFAQLIDSENNLIAGYDRFPLDGAYPTSTWLPGQVIIDPRFIPVDNMPAGEYRLVVGLYDPKTRQRLLTVVGADFVELTKLTLTQP